MVFSNPYDYATYSDAVALIPNLDLVPSSEMIYDMCSDYMSALIDRTRYGDQTGKLSFNLTMYFYCQVVEGVTNEKFFPDDYLSVSGAISSVTANKVTTSFAKNIVKENWESSLNQNTFGLNYLLLTKALNLAIGIDGYGNPFCAI